MGGAAGAHSMPNPSRSHPRDTKSDYTLEASRALPDAPATVAPDFAIVERRGGQMIKYVRMTGAVTIGALVTAAVMAQAPAVYPAKNQSASQQQKDVEECAAWATQSTGIDPAALAAAPASAATPAPAQPAAQRGERARGAVRGAAAGAVVGEIADDDAGEGAAVGAAAGVVAAGSRSRRERRDQQQQAAQQQQASEQQKAAQQQAEAKKQEQLATHNRASNACLEGRGYVVK